MFAVVPADGIAILPFDSRLNPEAVISRPLFAFSGRGDGKHPPDIVPGPVSSQTLPENIF
jgi:hypothetical protein